jgi:hypothetical protein
MKKVLCIALWFVPLMLFAQSPFDGTWKTNIAAAKLSQKPYTFWVKDGMYDCETCNPKIHVKADGQDQAVTGQAYDTIAITVTDARTIHVVGKKGGKPEFDSTRTVSDDGKALTVANTNYPADGSQSYKTEAKYSRTGKGPAGSNETSGSWRIQSVSEDAAGLTSTWKGSGDMLSVSDATGTSWEAKMDGKEYPVKGTYANETVSVKALGDRSIEITTRRDGQVYSVDKVTVSPDGKTMTTVSDNKRLGRVSTFVDEKQ